MTNARATTNKPHTSLTTWLIYAAIFLVPLVSGLLITLVLPHYGIANKFGGTGHDGYLELARSLYNGEGYRFSTDGPAAFHRPPLYPVLLMPFMGLPETALKASVVILNSLFLTIACLYTRRISTLLFPQAAVGTIAMVLLVCNPWTIRLLSSPLSAVMQMALYSALSFYFLRFCDQFRQYSKQPAKELAKSFFQLSLLTTAMCFAHGTSVYVCAAVFGVASIITLFNREWKLFALLLMTATLTLTALSPWAFRNQQILDRVELSSSGAGFTYYLGNIYWGIDDSAYLADKSTEENALRLGGINNFSEDMVDYWGVTNPAVDEQLRSSMVSHALAHPSAIAQKSLLNLADIYFPITHSLYCQSGASSAYCAESLSSYQLANRATRTALMLIIVALAFAYLLSNRTQKPALAWLALAGALLHTAPYLPIATYAHHGIYSLGAMPLLCSLAAAMLYRLRIRRALHDDINNPKDVWHDTPNKEAEVDVQATPVNRPVIARDQNGVKIDHIIG